MTAPLPAVRPRVLLTGASGDVGTRLRPLLLQAYGTLRLSDIAEPRMPLAPGETFMRADLADPAQVAGVVGDIDAIVHLGGFSVEGPWETIMQANIVGLHALYEAALRAGVQRIVFASSNHAVGFYRRDRPIDHAVPPRPDTRYGVSKAFGEALGALYADKHGLRVLNLRIGNVADAPIDRRRLSIWITPSDLMQLVRIGIEHPALRYEIVYGMSDNARSWWDNRRAHELGYRPTGCAEGHAATVLGREERPDPIGDRFQGGSYCSQEFDHPEPAASGRGGVA